MLHCVIKDGDTSGVCAVPFYDPGPFLSKCYADHIDINIQSSLLKIFGIFGATDSDKFLEIFRTRASKVRCSGPKGQYANGGRLMPNPYYDFGVKAFNYNLSYKYVNKSAVPKPISIVNGTNFFSLSVYQDYSAQKFVACNFFSSNITEVYNYGCFDLPPSEEACLSDIKCNWNSPSQSSCTLDTLSNGGYTCGDCSGN